MNYGPILIFIAAILWGLDGILRRSLFSLPPITIVFFEHLIGLIILAPFIYALWSKEKLSNREWFAMGIVSLLSGVIGTLFFTSALLEIKFIPFSVVFLVQKLQPIFTIFTAALVLKEPISKQFGVWAGVALIAGYFVTFPGGIVNVGEGGAYYIAAIYALIAAISWGSSTAFSRYVLLNHSNTFVTGLRFLITVPIAFVGVVVLDAFGSFSFVTPTNIGTLALIAISTGMVALWVYYRGLKSTPASVSAIVELAFPMVAVFIDYFLYGTTLTIGQYIAATLLVYAGYRVARLVPTSLQKEGTRGTV